MAWLLALWMAFADIAALKAEPDLERRSELALAAADRAIDAAKQAYTAGDENAVRADLQEIGQSVDVSYDALQHSGKPPRKSKYYKHAELKLRALVRRLNSFRDEVSFDNRQPVEALIKKLSDLHDELLAEIMSRKK